jgi:transposase
MGTQAAPERVFYDFCLDKYVPRDHILRQIERLLDLSDVPRELKPFYSHIGRPSIDPELMIRMLIGGLLRHPLRARPVRGGPSQSCLSVVLPSGP